MNETVNDPELQERLHEERRNKNHGFLELNKHLSFKAREKGIPISGEFELTPLCNFNCKMCYVHLDTDQLNGQSILSVDTWKDLMYQAWQAGMITATLTGGECLAYPGFNDLFIYLQSLGCQVSVLTNGFLLNEERIKFFRDHRPSSIQVTLYGCNDDVYEHVTGMRAFNTVVSNIKNAMEAGLPVYISLTPNRYLGEDLFETIRVAKKLCKTVLLNSYYISPREETGRSGSHHDAGTEVFIRAQNFIKQLDGIKPVVINEKDLPPYGGPFHESSDCGMMCGGGRSGFMIDWKGTMMPCTDMIGICGYPLKDGFTAAWAKVNEEANHWPRVPECKGCAYDPVCHNCAAYMLHFTDPGKLPTDLCKQTRELVRNGVMHLPDCK